MHVCTSPHQSTTPLTASAPIPRREKNSGFSNEAIACPSSTGLERTRLHSSGCTQAAALRALHGPKFVLGFVSVVGFAPTDSDAGRQQQQAGSSRQAGSRQRAL